MAWTDERMDDLVAAVQSGFDHAAAERTSIRAAIDRQGEQLRGEMAAQRVELQGAIEGQVEQLRAEMTAQRVELQGAIGRQGDQLRGEIRGVDARVERLDDRLGREVAALRQVMVRFAVALFVALAALTATVIGAVVGGTFAA